MEWKAYNFLLSNIFFPHDLVIFIDYKLYFTNGTYNNNKAE